MLRASTLWSRTRLAVSSRRKYTGSCPSTVESFRNWLDISLRKRRASANVLVCLMARMKRSKLRSLSRGASLGIWTFLGGLGDGGACSSRAARSLRTDFRSCNTVRPYPSISWFQVSGSANMCITGDKTAQATISLISKFTAGLVAMLLGMTLGSRRATMPRRCCC